MRHISLIMDGNGRWAEAKGLARLHGHIEGAKAVIKAIELGEEMGIPYLSLYAFSSENFKREKKEVQGIFSVIADFLQNTLLPIIKKRNFQMRFIGDLNKLPETLLEVIAKVNAQGLNNSGMTIIIALAYGGREEVTKAFNSLMKSKFINSDTSFVTYDEIASHLYTALLPDPDIVVRYGGYQRLSNFMPLQSAYSELFFLDKLWPDFDKRDIYDIAEKYSSIKRNFGDIPK